LLFHLGPAPVPARPARARSKPAQAHLALPPPRARPGLAGDREHPAGATPRRPSWARLGLLCSTPIKLPCHLPHLRAASPTAERRRHLRSQAPLRRPAGRGSRQSTPSPP
jgi:hypothetical protein